MRNFVLVTVLAVSLMPAAFAKSMSTSFSITLTIPEKPASTEEYTSSTNTPTVQETRNGRTVLVQTSLAE